MCLFTAKLHTDGTDGTPALMLTNAQQLDTNMHKNLEPEIKGTPCERTLLASVTSSLSLTDTHGHAHTHTHTGIKRIWTGWENSVTLREVLKFLWGEVSKRIVSWDMEIAHGSHLCRRCHDNICSQTCSTEVRTQTHTHSLHTHLSMLIAHRLRILAVHIITSSVTKMLQ